MASAQAHTDTNEHIHSHQLVSQCILAYSTTLKESILLSNIFLFSRFFSSACLLVHLFRISFLRNCTQLVAWLGMGYFQKTISCARKRCSLIMEIQYVLWKWYPLTKLCGCGELVVYCCVYDEHEHRRKKNRFDSIGQQLASTKSHQFGMLRICLCMYATIVENCIKMNQQTKSITKNEFEIR